MMNNVEEINEEEEVRLCFIRLVGEENDGIFRYEFIFTNDIDTVFGNDFNHKPACLVNDLMVDDQYITEIHIVRMKIKLDLIQDSCCFSVSDSYDGIVAVAWQNIDDMIEFPEDGRIFFRFGETIEEVENKLAIKNVIMI